MTEGLRGLRAAGQERQERHVSPRQIVFTLYRRKWVILAISLPLILIGTISLSMRVSTFTAAARLVVELTDVEEPRWNVNQRSIDYDRELSTLSNIATSVPVARLAAASLQDSLATLKHFEPKLDLETPNALVRYLVDRCEAMVVGESRLLELRFTAVHPRLALLCVGAMRDAFLEFQIRGRNDPRAIAYYREQIQVVRGEIDSLMAESAAILRDSGYSMIDENLFHESGAMTALEVTLEESRIARGALEVQVASLQKALAGDPRDFPMGESESRVTPLVYWRGNVSERETDVELTRAVHTEDSLPVQRKKELLAKALKRLHEEEATYVRSLEIQLSLARAKEASLTEMLERLRDRRRAAPEAQHRVKLIETQVTSMKELLEDLQGKLGEVRISRLADERISSILPLTDPQMVHIFAGTQTRIYFLLIIFFALALGVTVAFVLDSLDHRILTPVDVEDKLQLPVFASIVEAD